MRRIFTPILQICFGILLFTISLILIAFALDLLPDENKTALEARARVSESLAIQLAVAASRNDVAAIKETITSLVARSSGDVLSVAMRRSNGEIVVETGNHSTFWVDPPDNKSIETHVQIPLKNGKADWGRIEIAYRQLATGPFAFGFSRKMIALLGFFVGAGFLGYYFILKRSLRELDPSAVIPERVQAAFDALAEGVLIMDEHERLLLANKAFAKCLGTTPDILFGSKVEELPWLQFRQEFVSEELPWRIAIRTGQAVTGSLMGLRDASGTQRKMVVNATRITDGKNLTRGVIATFDDVTLLQEKNEQLETSIEQLNNFQRKIEQQNRELQFLAACDPLTGCLNRRAFFAEVERLVVESKEPITVLMLDLDHFKSINDRFGHAVGDEVLSGFAGILKRLCENLGPVGRYGGEEFCIAMSRLSEKEVENLADHICRAVSDVKSWLPNGDSVTVSIGIASEGNSRNIGDIIKHADAALYAAKTTGRNKAVNWSDMPIYTKPVNQVSAASNLPSPLSVSPSRAESEPTIADESTNFPESELARKHVDEIIRNDDGRRCFAAVHLVIDGFDCLHSDNLSNSASHLLEKIVERIARHLREGDMLARLDTDRFYLLLDPLEDKTQAKLMLEEIHSEFSRPFFVDGGEVLGSISIGVSVYPEHGCNYHSLRSNAEIAMRQAKRAAKGGVSFFEASMVQAASARTEAERRLRLAVRDRSFCCAFQPKVDISNEKVIGFEALARWRTGHDEIQLPGEFIGLATELNLIDQIAIIVLETAIGSFDQLDAEFGSHTTVSVNIAAKQANDAQFMSAILEILKGTHLARRIVLELTEDSFISKGSFQTEYMPALKAIGVKISIDDFGTGYSSLGALADIAVDEIKIDRSFITDIHNRTRSQSVLRAINLLGDSLGLTLVAEGVETYEELVYLRATTTIRYVQGYYFSKPFYLDDFMDARSAMPMGRSHQASRIHQPSRAAS